MDEIFSTFKHLAHRYSSRWAAIDGALRRVRAHDGGGRGTDGERTRRMLVNVFRNQTYPEQVRDRLRTDRVNALRRLEKPLAEALGHLVTIELAEALLGEVDEAERERDRERGAAEQVERHSVYGPLIETLHIHGVNRGHYTTLTEAELSVIAKYILRKAAGRLEGLPSIRSDGEARSPDGRRHPFWNPYHLPRSG